MDRGIICNQLACPCCAKELTAYSKVKSAGVSKIKSAKSVRKYITRRYAIWHIYQNLPRIILVYKIYGLKLLALEADIQTWLYQILRKLYLDYSFPNSFPSIQTTHLLFIREINHSYVPRKLARFGRSTQFIESVRYEYLSLLEIMWDLFILFMNF